MHEVFVVVLNLYFNIIDKVNKKSNIVEEMNRLTCVGIVNNVGINNL